MRSACPNCGYSFADPSWYAGNACDHEAGWYRDWLADVTGALELIASGEDPDPVSTAKAALDPFRRPW